MTNEKLQMYTSTDGVVTLEVSLEQPASHPAKQPQIVARLIIKVS